MVRLPTPAALATSSIVVFVYPSTPSSRSAASRIASRVPVGDMRDLGWRLAILHDFGFSCNNNLDGLGPDAPDTGASRSRPGRGREPPGGCGSEVASCHPKCDRGKRPQGVLAPAPGSVFAILAGSAPSGARTATWTRPR